MGVFEWIGEAIGNACAATAEFFGSVFEGILSFFGGMFKKIGKDSLTGIVTDLADGDSTSQDDMSDIVDAVTAPMAEGWMKHLKEIEKRHSELSPEDSKDEVEEMWKSAKEELVTSALIATVIEALSLGQIEGIMDVTKITDATLGMSSFTNKASMMMLDTQLLTSYQRYLNREHPNRIAGSGDLIRFALREVWDPTRRPELLEELPPSEYYDYMLEQGYTEDRANDWWASHWVLPSVGQLNEMLHRREITPEEWDRFVKYNDFDPTIRPWLKAISYKPYTRVDTRRMWDLRELSEQEVFDNYQDLGYDDAHARKMTTWTKLYVTAIDVRARYSKGWITAEDVKSEIIAAGMKPERAEIWVQKIIKADQETRTVKERDVTKSEIIKGVKTGVITRSDGIELLVGMGYDEDEANYILEINIPIDEEDEVVKERQLTKADILKALKTEVITREEAKVQLMGIRYPSAAAETLLEIFDAQVKIPPTPRLREASKADIVLGVKKGLITQEEAYGMLLDLGFSSDAAIFVLTVKTEESPFSPINYDEYWDLVNLRRKVQGLPIRKKKLEAKKTGTGSDKTTEAPTSKTKQP